MNTPVVLPCSVNWPILKYLPDWHSLALKYFKQLMYLQIFHDQLHIMFYSLDPSCYVIEGVILLYNFPFHQMLYKSVHSNSKHILKKIMSKKVTIPLTQKLPHLNLLPALASSALSSLVSTPAIMDKYTTGL